LTKKDKHIEAAQKFLLKNQLPKAIKEYQRAVELDPKDMRCRQRLAETFNRAKMVEEAIGEYQIVAKSYSENGFYLKAIAVFKQIQKLTPSNPDTYLKLADLNTKQGLTGNALSEYRILLGIYEKENKIKEATKVLQKMKDLEPENLNVRFKITANLVKAEQIAEAKQEIEDIKNFLEKKKDYPKLLKLYESSRSLLPDDLLIESEYGRALALAGEKGAALEIIEPLLAQGIEVKAVLRTLSKAFRAAEAYEQEQSALQQFLAIDDANLDARQELIDSYLRGGAWDKAVTELENWKEPLYRDGRSTFLKERYERLKDELPGREDLLLALRWVYELTGDGAKLLEIEGALGGEAIGLSLGAKAVPQEEEVSLESLLTVEVDESPSDSDAVALEPAAEESFDLPPLEEAPVEDPSAASVPDGSDLDMELELDLDFDDEPAPLVGPGEDEPLVELELPDEHFDLDGLILSSEEDISAEDQESLLAGEIIEPVEPMPAAEPEPVASRAAVQIDFNAELDEAQFYVKHDLYNDAEVICQRILEADPTFKPAIQLLQEIDAKRLGKGSSPAPKDDFFDLGAELRQDAVSDTVAAISNKEQGLLDGIFSEFKKGVEDQIGNEDAESHYNLGIAYKEMGLLDDAVAEFEKAMAHPDRTVDCLTLKGICLAEGGKLAAAQEVFRAGLKLSELNPEEIASLHYELGLLAEKTEHPMEALEHFQAVSDADSFFRDVGEKIRQLRRELGLESEEGGETPSGSKNRVSYL